VSAPETLAVAIVGPDGRMGSFARRLIAETPGFELRAEIRRGEELADALRKSRATVALDVTRAGLGFEHAATMLASGVRPLVGTSGVTPAENAHLDAMARELGLGGLVVPNFSLGMWLLQRAGGRGRAPLRAGRDRRDAPREEEGRAVGDRPRQPRSACAPRGKAQRATSRSTRSVSPVSTRTSS
jgi:hypothetical protein